MATHSRSAIIKAIIGNALVTGIKAIATVFSGSGAMLAETIHSLVDTLNQGLLLIGEKRSLRPATEEHPWGYGPEASFWGLLAAIGILLFGGAFSIQHGVASLAHPQVPEHLAWVLGVLALATIIEAAVLISVVRGLAVSRGDASWGEHLQSQPPGVMTVVLEDAAAVLGCLIAGAAVGLCRWTGNGIYDAIAQIVIGLLLTVVGLYLVWRNRGVLVGQALPRRRVTEIRIFLEDIDGVDRVTDIKTRQLTAHTFLLKAEVVFSGGEIAARLMKDFAPRVADLHDQKGTAEILGRFGESMMIELARLVDRIESEVRERFPGAVHIDLEPHVRDVP